MELFARFDRDRDGIINTHDIITKISESDETGIILSPTIKSEVRLDDLEVPAMMDTLHDKLIQKSAVKRPNYSKIELTKHFKELDTERDGSISARELGHTLEHKLNLKLPDDQLNKLAYDFPASNPDRVDYKQLIDKISKHVKPVIPKLKIPPPTLYLFVIF